MRIALACIALLLSIAPAAALEARAVNDADWAPRKSAKVAKAAVDPLLVKAQVLLDRARFSPGEIDGRPGDNFNKAVAAFAAQHGIAGVTELTEAIWRKLAAVSAEPALTEYTIAPEDVRGPFAKRIPAKFEDMQHLPAMAYTSMREKLAEKFHMSEALLAALNPGRDLSRAGETIWVANVAGPRPDAKAARIEVDKTVQTLKAFDRDGNLIAVYPPTAGSAHKPAPAGRLKVVGVRENPHYRYNPAYAFKGVRTRQPFTINPGPNSPVGAVWIGLSGEGFGIHGTPAPDRIGKTQSHGCIRLTNWDALALAAVTGKGTPVDFTGDEQARLAKAQAPRRRR